MVKVLSAAAGRCQRALSAGLSLLLLSGAGAHAAEPPGALRAADYFQGKQLTLARAIDTDRAEAVAAALADGADARAAGKEGLTPLLFAVGNRRKGAVAALLEQGADPNRRADNGENAVTIAAMRLAREDLDYLRLLLEHGGDPDTRWTDHDPVVVLLVGQYNTAGIRLLAEHGADLNILDRTGTPVLIVAAMCQYWDCVAALLEGGADPRVRWKNLRVDVASLVADVKVTPDEPLYPFYAKVRALLHDQGVQVPPVDVPKDEAQLVEWAEQLVTAVTRGLGPPGAVKLDAHDNALFPGLDFHLDRASGNLTVRIVIEPQVSVDVAEGMRTASRALVQALNEPQAGGRFEQGGGHFAYDEERRAFLLVREFSVGAYRLRPFGEAVKEMHALAAVWRQEWLAQVYDILRGKVAPPGVPVTRRQAGPPFKVTREAALAHARNSLPDLFPQHDFVVQEEQTQARRFGWVFFFAPRRYLVSHDQKDLVPGLGALVIEGATNELSILPLSTTPEAAVNLWEKQWSQRNGLE